MESFITAAEASRYFPIPPGYDKPFVVLTNPLGEHLINSCPWCETESFGASSADHPFDQPWVVIGSAGIGVEPPSPPPIPAVPEPTSFALLLLGLAVFICRNRVSTKGAL